MQRRCDCNNGTFPFRRCSSCSVTQRRRRATCLRTSASLCPSVDHTSSRCRLTFVCGTLLSVMHDSLSQVKLNEGIWELLGDQDGDARWRARHSIRGTSCRRADVGLSQFRNCLSLHAALLPRSPLHLSIRIRTWHATVGHLPF